MNQQVMADVERWRGEAQSKRRQARAFTPEDSRREQLLQDAVAALNRAISALKRELRAVETLSDTSDDCVELRRLLSQTLGSLGGTYRDAKDYDQAIKYYDEGNKVEEKRRTSDGALDSYNLVQLLVARLLSDAAQLNDSKFQHDLAEAQNELKRQETLGRRDPWWLADIVTVRFLQNKDANDLLADLDNRKPKPDTAFYESTYEAIKALIDDGLGKDSPIESNLRQFQAMLQRRGGLRSSG